MHNIIQINSGNKNCISLRRKETICLINRFGLRFDAIWILYKMFLKSGLANKAELGKKIVWQYFNLILFHFVGLESRIFLADFTEYFFIPYCAVH